MSIEKHLNKYFGDIEKEKIQDLILDSVNIPEIKTDEKKILEGYKNVKILSLNFCGVKSLNNLPNIVDLEAVRLNLSSLIYVIINLKVRS